VANICSVKRRNSPRSTLSAESKSAATKVTVSTLRSSADLITEARLRAAFSNAACATSCSLAWIATKAVIDKTMPTARTSMLATRYRNPVSPPCRKLFMRPWAPRNGVDLDGFRSNANTANHRLPWVRNLYATPTAGARDSCLFVPAQSRVTQARRAKHASVARESLKFSVLRMLRDLADSARP